MQHNWIYITFTAVTAAGVLLQAIVLLLMFVALRGALGRLNQVSKLAEEHVIPAMASARKLIDDITPQVKTVAVNAAEVSQHAAAISENAAAVSKTLREQTEEMSATVSDLRQKTEVQAERVDEMVTGTLDTLAHATAVVQRAVSGPVRQVGAVLNGLRAGFDVLRSREPEAHASADGDHFV